MPSRENNHIPIPAPKRSTRQRKIPAWTEEFVMMNQTQPDRLQSAVFVKVFMSDGSLRDIDQRCRLVKPSDLQTVSRAVHQKDHDNSVVSCESKCQTLFALSEFHCFCLSNFPVSTGNCIPTYCPGNLNDFCGSNGDNYLSNGVTDVMIYETDASIPPNTTGAEECLVVEYTRDVVLGAYNKIVRGFQNPNDMSCNTENGFICKLEGAVIVDLSRQHYNRPARTWTDAVRQCYKQNGYQISTDVDSVVQNNSELSYFEKAWIGAFRRHHGFTISTKTVGATSDEDLVITTSILATLLGLGILITIAIFLRKVYIKVIEKKNGRSYRPSRSNQKVKHDHLHYEQQLSAIGDEPVYSVIFDKNLEAPRYSEVVESDVLRAKRSNDSPYAYVNTRNLSESSTTETQQRLSGYFEMRPKKKSRNHIELSWLKFLEREQERLNRMSVGRLSTTTERQSYVDMSLENPTLRKSQASMRMLMQLSTINDKPVYSVLFDKNVEASIYSEVLASDITPILTEIPSTDTKQRRSGYFEMRPKAWLKSPERDQEKRLNRMSVEMLSTTTERQSYVDMSLENPIPDP
uniref:Uncharacterized protein n=1 Tax=Magallana gigas TaxID=29159 RepID=K1QES4_MAGGI